MEHLETVTLIEGFGNEVLLVFSLTAAMLAAVVVQLIIRSPGRRQNAFIGESRTQFVSRTVQQLPRARIEPIDRPSDVRADTHLPEVPETPQDSGDAPESAEEKEKTPPAEDLTEVPIRLKYLNDTERTVESPLSIRIGDFKDKFFPDERSAGKVIRLISKGKLLSDERCSLRQYGVNAESNILHVQISNPPPPPATTASPQLHNASRLEANIASLAYIVLGAMLVLFWYVHFQYRDLFTNSATTALVGISGLFCVFVFAPTQPVYFSVPPNGPEL